MVCAIEAKGIWKTVSDGEEEIDILQDVNLSLSEGESLAIVGPSGCGKSTLLGLLAGLDVPSRGEIFWSGRSISTLSEEDRALARNGQLGFVFQSFQLLPQFTALENVTLPLELMGEARPEVKAKALLEQVGLGGRLNHFPSTLSGGEQQRVALARAFVAEPRLLFADEPTGSLDSASGERIMALLFELQQRLGTTVVVVTHDPALASRCQHQIRLSAGRVL